MALPPDHLIVEKPNMFVTQHGAYTLMRAAGSLLDAIQPQSDSLHYLHNTIYDCLDVFEWIGFNCNNIGIESR